MDFNRVDCNTGVQKIITEGMTVIGRRRRQVTEVRVVRNTQTSGGDNKAGEENWRHRLYCDVT